VSGSTGHHLGDRLSALLDGELAPAEAAAARIHLEGCGRCRAELRAVEEARGALRSLPWLEPPPSLSAWVGRRRRRTRRAAVGLVASAAAAAALVVAAPHRPPTVRPPVADLVDVHAATASVAGDPVSELVSVGIPVGEGR
jgi:anti-sigma factor RsiW